jgi:hypothetical protein
METRKLKWLLCVIAAVLNLGGGPMAWARAAADSHPPEVTGAAETFLPDCHQHAASAEDAPAEPADSRTPTCCETGSCACAVAQGAPAPAFLSECTDAMSGPASGFMLWDFPSTLPDDALRPPIR